MIMPATVSSAQAPPVETSSYRRIRVVLDLSEGDAADLANSIYYARQYVDNWRPDPRRMIELEQALLRELEAGK